MRVTNSMLVSNFMRNLNTNMNRMDALQNQLASGRKFANISDDPAALIYSQGARNKIARLSHYSRTVESAQDWLRQVESSVMDLQERVADIYTSVVNAGNDAMGLGANSDKASIGMLIDQLRDHYLDTLNSTFGDKYLFGGYNTPGDSSTGKIGPFEIRLYEGVDTLHYNGHPLPASFPGVYEFGNFTVNVTGTYSIFNGTQFVDLPPNMLNLHEGATSVQEVQDRVKEINDLVNDIAALNAQISTFGGVTPPDPPVGTGLGLPGWWNPGMQSGGVNHFERIVDSDGKHRYVLRFAEGASAYHEPFDPNFVNLWNARDDAFAKLQDYVNFGAQGFGYMHMDGVMTRDGSQIVNGITFDTLFLDLGLFQQRDPVTGLPTREFPLIGIDNTPYELKFTGVEEEIPSILDRLWGDVLHFDVGPSISMPVTLSGLDLIYFTTRDEDGKPITMNIFHLLDKIHKEVAAGEPADTIGGLNIKQLQDAQDHLLSKTSEVGGRVRRLELLAYRYEQDYINYTQMQSDAEDVNFADAIMYQKMAEAVYQAALSTGARIIQPTLMDFLR